MDTQFPMYPATTISLQCGLFLVEVKSQKINTHTHTYMKACPLFLTFITFSASERLPKNVNTRDCFPTPLTIIRFLFTLLWLNTWTIFNISYIRESPCIWSNQEFLKAFLYFLHVQQSLHCFFKSWVLKRHKKELQVFLDPLHCRVLYHYEVSCGY